MNLPQLTARIGQLAKEQMHLTSDLAVLVKTVNLKDEDKPYRIFLTFDLEQEEIRFDEPFPYQSGDEYQYHYFGNNSAAGMQYYLTRDGKSLHYLLKSALSDLYLVLEKHQMQQGELHTILSELAAKKLIYLGANKGKGSVNLSKMAHVSNLKIDEKNNFIVDGVSRKAEDFLRYINGYQDRNIVFPLIIPRVVSSSFSNPVILSQHADYVAVAKSEQNLIVSAQKGKAKYCFVCQELRPDVSSKLTADFSRSGINKIFGTTTFNYACQLNKQNYDHNYAICTDCYQNLLFGEKKVAENFSFRIAGERAFILPEGLISNFDYNDLELQKNRTKDLIEKGVIDDLGQQIDVAAEDLNHPDQYVVHFFVYRTDGNSVTVLETLEDVPVLHIRHIAEILGKWAAKMHPHIGLMSISSIYSLIPIRTNKNKEQLDVQRVLSIYRALFSRIKIETFVLFQYAAEALDKGFREIRKKKIAQFHNLALMNYWPDKEDGYFRKIIYRYLCLLQTFQELGLLDKTIFHDKGVKPMDLEGMHEEIHRAEAFLEEQSFGKVPRAIFYLGMLLKKVANAQYEKGHRSKPILNKLTFQGMNQREIIWLYQEILEKLQQYRKMNLPNEQLIRAFNYYYGSLTEEKKLTDQEHIFYLMAGYSFAVGKYRDAEAGEDEEIQYQSVGEGVE